jgi:serine/threonine protein kinase
MRFAVKVFNITAHASSSSSTSAAEDEEIHYARKCYHRELDFLRSLSHPHIIAYEDSTVREGVPYVIVEKMNCTLLELQMDRTTQAPFGQFSPIELNSRIISLQLLDGLSYLHNLHIVSTTLHLSSLLTSLWSDPQRYQT